jgi:hypothetical protein
MVDDRYESSLAKDEVQHAHIHLRGLEAELIELVNSNLDSKAQSRWEDSDDALFGPYTAYMQPAWRSGLPLRPAQLWIDHIKPQVDVLEAEIGLIHKGSPLYNVGVCFFIAGDYARAVQYIAAAGEEEERRSPGGAKRLLTGVGLMSEQVFLKPLYTPLAAEFGSDYEAATGCSLSPDEVRTLVEFLSERLGDAVLFIAALHRLFSQLEGPENTGSRLERIRALADVLLVFESSLRRWQGKCQGNLYRRTQELLRSSTPAFRAFNQRCAQYDQNPEDIENLNALINTEHEAFDGATSRSERAAIAAFLTYKVRNSVMHGLEEQLVLFSDRARLLKTFGLALISVRLSRSGAEGTVVNLL